MKRLLAIALLVAGCGGPAAVAVGSPTSVPTATATTTPTATPTARPTPSPLPTPAPTSTPVASRYTDAQLQARLDALRAASDCDAIAALDVTDAGDAVVVDHQDALETCNLVGVVYPTAKPAKTVTVTGTGSRNTKPFSLGVAAYSVVVKGNGPRGNVAVTLYTVSGEYVDLLVNEISNGGSYRYETVVYDQGCSTLEPCYYLDATMPRAAWSVTFIPLP